MQTFQSADEMFRTMLKTVDLFGADMDSRVGPCRDYIVWSGTLVNPRARRIMNPVRNLRPGYPEASVAYNLAQRNDASILFWNENGRRVLDDDSEVFHGANYGQRMMVHLWDRIEMLVDGDSRRAWVPIWNPDLDGFDYAREGKDVPCTIGFNLRVVSDALHMQVMMRSQSVYGVFPYDLYLFAVLQELIANQLDLELGSLDWSCLSAHYFMREQEQVHEALAYYDEEGVPLEQEEPIKYDLQGAIDVYPQVYEELTGRADGRESFGGNTSDPVINGMIQGHQEIYAEGMIAT